MNRLGIGLGTIYEILDCKRIYEKYRIGAKVQSEDMNALKRLSSSNRVVFYFHNGELYAKSPYI